jgi:hypothetical protein
VRWLSRLDVDFEQRDLVATPGALAGGDQLATVGGGADGERLDVLADDGAGGREARGIVEGVLEGDELLVLVVAVEGGFGDQAVQVRVGLAGWADLGLLHNIRRLQ